MGTQKKTWGTIKELCNGNTKPSITEIFHDGVRYNETKDIASIFNQFFVTIANNLAEALPQSSISPYLYVDPNASPPIQHTPVSHEEVSNIIKSMKVTKTGVHEISINLFKKYHMFFLPCLCDMINLCLSTGIFPDCLKIAIVIPIFKKGHASDVSNYRPIALLPFLSKIIERCIFDRLSIYASSCNLIGPAQFGFRKGKSTHDAITLITENIYEAFNIGNGTFNINIFIDFQKAFDTIDHAILLNKLRIYGITGTFHDLIKNYLSNRFQSVRVGDCLSSPLKITKGVPQGSVLGSLLFLLFISDLPNVSGILTSILFADDLALSFTCNDANECNIICNRELNRLFEWSASNKLSINYGRTKSYFMINTYGNIEQDAFNININGITLENVSQAKYLGVVLDPKLKFNKHIDYIAEKISKSTGILYKLKKLKIPIQILKQIYYSLIYSIINYNICAYGGTYNTHINRLFLLQKRAIRLICGESFLAHTDPLFYRTQILKIHDIYRLNVAVYMFEARHSGEFDRNHPYPTRSYNDLVPIYARLNVTQNYLKVSGPNVWNSIPQEIRNLPSLSMFKNRYKKYLLSLYIQEN